MADPDRAVEWDRDRDKVVEWAEAVIVNKSVYLKAERLKTKHMRRY